MRVAERDILMHGIVRDEDRCAPEHLLVCLGSCARMGQGKDAGD